MVAQRRAVAGALDALLDDHIRRTWRVIHVMQLSIAQVCWTSERRVGGSLPPPCL
jgi:phage terminase large subunit GpA-like protein